MEAEAMMEVAGYSISKDLLIDLTYLASPPVPYPHCMDALKRNNVTLSHDWQLEFAADRSKNGYDGGLFSTQIDGEKHYFIFHRGGNDPRDLPAMGRIANSKVPEQGVDACDFTDKAMAYVAEQHPNEDTTVVQVGYSLGAALSIMACRDEQPVIAIEGPGTRDILENQERNPKAVGENVLEVLSPLGNVVNAHGEHVGQIVEPGDDSWHSDKVSIFEFLHRTVDSHHIVGLRRKIREETEFETVPAEESDRPETVIGAFKEYVDEGKGDNPGIRVRALSGATDALVATGLDKPLTKVAVFGLDVVGNTMRTLFNRSDEHKDNEDVHQEKSDSKQPEAPEPELHTPEPEVASTKYRDIATSTRGKGRAVSH